MGKVLAVLLLLVVVVLAVQAYRRSQQRSGPGVRRPGSTDTGTTAGAGYVGWSDGGVDGGAHGHGSSGSDGGSSGSDGGA